MHMHIRRLILRHPAVLPASSSVLRPLQNSSRSTVTDPSMTTKSFFDLPPEVRVKVYKFLFAGCQLEVSVTQRDTAKIARERNSANMLHSAVLETCTKINIEAFPILAGSINLTLEYCDVARGNDFAQGNVRDSIEDLPTGLDLSHLAKLPYMPAFLLRVLPMIENLTYTDRWGNPGVCVGMESLPKLRVLSVDSADGDWFENVRSPPPYKDFIEGSEDLDARMAIGARNFILSNSPSREQVRKILAHPNRTFKLLYIWIMDHTCERTDPENTCLCDEKGLVHPQDSTPVMVGRLFAPFLHSTNVLCQGFEVDIGSKAPVLADKWFWWTSDKRYNTYEELLEEAKRRQSAETEGYRSEKKPDSKTQGEQRILLTNHCLGSRL